LNKPDLTIYENKVTSVNGQTGAVNIDVGVTSVNGTTGAVTVKENVRADWNATTGDAQILNKPFVPEESDITNWGFTKNEGTVKDITINGQNITPDHTGTIDLG
jgi:hypothetical protein